jgi:hypothetical protein
MIPYTRDALEEDEYAATYIGKGFAKYFECEDNTQRLYCGKVHCKLFVTL